MSAARGRRFIDGNISLLANFLGKQALGIVKDKTSRIDELKNRFHKDAQFLFHILHTSNAKDLILRLNFNGHFSDTF